MFVSMELNGRNNAFVGLNQKLEIKKKLDREEQ